MSNNSLPDAHFNEKSHSKKNLSLIYNLISFRKLANEVVDFFFLFIFDEAFTFATFFNWFHMIHRISSLRSFFPTTSNGNHFQSLAFFFSLHLQLSTYVIEVKEQL